MMAAPSKATGPLGNMTQHDTFDLIELIQGHEALWNVRSLSYRNQTLKKSRMDFCAGKSIREDGDPVHR